MQAIMMSILLLALTALSTCAPRGDVEEEERPSARYVHLEDLPSIHDVVDKVKTVGLKGLLAKYKLKKPVIEKVIEKAHKLKKPVVEKWVPPVTEEVLETVPCVYYPKYDLHAPPSVPLPYYYYYY